MDWDDRKSPKALKAALQERRFAEAEVLTSAFLQDLEQTRRRVPASVACAVLGTLRSFTRFEALHAVSRLLEVGGQDDPEVRRQLAQARIEQGEVTTAIDGLLELQASIEEGLEETADPLEKRKLENELGESLGLLGRAYKQLYVMAKPTPREQRTHDLQHALDYYGRAFNEGLGDYLWHGVNYMALLTHAERIRKGKTQVYPAVKQAEQILKTLADKEATEPLQPWDLANRAEAQLACGSFSEARAAVQAYLDAPGLNAFNVQSTRRQFEQIWSLTERETPGDEILPMMTARLAELGGVQTELPTSVAAAKELQRVWDKTGYKPLRWLQTAIERARAVARLGPDKYEGHGTGFLFDGAWIGPKYAGRHLLLTNAHVCTNDPAVQKRHPRPTGPEKQKAVFLAAGDEEAAHELALHAVLWTSPPDELDATLLEIDPPPEGAKPPPLATTNPTPEGVDARVNILGHPRGLNLRVSLQDNEVVSVEDPYIHYRTPTDPGSSGSPVFDQSWNLVALHHASDTQKKANEGVRMDRLIEAMQKELL